MREYAFFHFYVVFLQHCDILSNCFEISSLKFVENLSSFWGSGPPQVAFIKKVQEELNYLGSGMQSIICHFGRDFRLSGSASNVHPVSSLEKNQSRWSFFFYFSRFKLPKTLFSQSIKVRFPFPEYFIFQSPSVTIFSLLLNSHPFIHLDFEIKKRSGKNFQSYHTLSQKRQDPC